MLMLSNERDITRGKKFSYDVVHRWEGNPLLTIEDIPFPCNTVFNAACAKYNGQYMLLLRVEDLIGRSVFALARTIDFETFERIALVSEPENKDGVLFPKKINGKYARLDRPVAGGIANIWISYSDDLITWGNSRCVMTVRDDHWDSWRIGACTQPIKIDDGWIIIYHGVKAASGGPIYRLGAAVLAEDDPSRVLCRSTIPILSPREYYERVGDVNNVVFSCGAILEDDGRELKIYYGASDTSICLGTANINELMQFCTIGEH